MGTDGIGIQPAALKRSVYGELVALLIGVVSASGFWLALVITQRCAKHDLVVKIAVETERRSFGVEARQSARFGPGHPVTGTPDGNIAAAWHRRVAARVPLSEEMLANFDRIEHGKITGGLCRHADGCRRCDLHGLQILRVNVSGQSHPVRQDQRIAVDGLCTILATYSAGGRQEVIVVRHQQEEILGCVFVQSGQQRHAFHLLCQCQPRRCGIVDIDAELAQLRSVEDVDDFHLTDRRNRRVENAARGNGSRRGFERRTGNVGGTGGVDQQHALVHRVQQSLTETIAIA